MTTQFEFPGYSVIEQIYTGARVLVYRAVRNSDQRAVVIKLLRHELPSFSELTQLRNQYAITKALDFPGVSKPYSLEPYRNSYALIMEDSNGISLQEWMRQKSKVVAKTRSVAESERPLSSLLSPIPLADFFSIAGQLLDTLHLLHQRRIIHNNLQPANILIQPETMQVTLIDFSIASLLPRETQEIQSSNGLQGSLAYLSPEQTGRMNRGIDYRSDFYALGITFFEMLTGELPFQSNDPLELIHCHIAKPLPFAYDLNPEVPEMVGALICKLTAKNAEDRYQSAIGIKHDLIKCQERWQAADQHTQFELGQGDVSERFMIPEKLYGREQEVETLLNAFGRVATGSSELMLVAGFSGIGKTAVVNEVQKPIVRQRGYFIKGKYDQFNRNIPLSAFVHCFRDLMGQLLSENDQQLAEWKQQILSALGENGQVLIEVIPELERIIGKQPSAPELSGSAAQNRFNLLFQKFIALFATQAHPLVIFLDDLQWADFASLNLLQVLMQETAYLLVIGAYRDNEVSPAHPLMITIEEIQKMGATVNSITLKSLSSEHINRLVADALRCEFSLAQPLSELVMHKTSGNPFFATQFLKALHEEGQITFDWETRLWQCQIAAVRAMTLTDDVVEFMALQLQKLPVEAQTALQLAACIGAQFDLRTLAIVLQQSQPETAAALWKVLQEGLIVPQSEIYKFYLGEIETAATVNQETIEKPLNYRFLHDRVQQAAYSLIPDDQKQATHLKIGRLLLENIPPEALEISIFDIVNQLNHGVDIIVQSSEKYELAQLNLIAGKKAKASTAYKAAAKYLTVGRELLSADCWETHYSLAFKLCRECAECEYLTGNFEQAEQLFNLALDHTQDQFAQADIYGIQMYLKMTQGENIAAGLESGLKGLSVMGMALPNTAETQEAAMATELEILNAKLSAINPADLFDLPEMTDPVKKVCMSLLADLWAAAYMEGNPHLSSLIPLLMVSLSLKHGNAESSGFAYCLYGMSLANQGHYQAAYEFGSLALKLDKRFHSTQFIFKTNNIFAHTINPYNRHLKTNLPISQQAFQVCQETGNLVFGVWAVSFIIWAMFIKGSYLSDVYAETEKYLSYVQQVNDSNMLYAFTLQRQFLLHMQGISESTDLLENKATQTGANIPYIEVWRQKRNFEHGINWFCFLKLQLAYLYGRYSEAVAAATEAEATLAANAGFFPIIQYHFYYPLSLAALYPTASDAEKPAFWSILQQHQQILKNWSENCPENFLHRYLLLSAEMAHLADNPFEASDYYDRAIVAAKANEYIHEEALANELAAKFYLAWNKVRIAQEYITEAYYGYVRWGAKAKVADLERRYPQLLVPVLQQICPLPSLPETVFASGTVIANHSSASISDSLDLMTILKASQSLSKEIKLDKLLSTLLQLIIENAGADKCVLVLMRDQRLLVKGLAVVGAEPVVLQRIPVEESQDIPLKLVYCVKNSSEPLMLANGTANTNFATDPYFLQHQPKSILCVPISHKGKLVGVVYLENNQTINAFTSGRVHILNMLCAQAAVSLENANLYERTQQYAQQLEHSLEALRNSEARFQNLAANIPGMIYQFHLAADGSTSTPYVSSGCLDLYEVEAEAVMAGQHNVYTMYHPDDRAALEQRVAHSAQTLTPFKYEWRIVTPSGIVKWIQAVSRPERKPDGSTVWDGVVIDVSDRKQAERQLQESQQFLRLLIDNMPQLVFWKDHNLNFLGCNAAAAQSLNLESPDQIMGKTDYDFFETDQAYFHRLNNRRVMDSGQAELHSLNTRHLEDELHWFDVNTMPLRDLNNNVVGVLSMIQDITDRKKAEAALQEQEQFLRSIYNGVDMFIIVVDVMKDGTFRYAGWNPLTEKATGVREIDGIGKTPVEVYGEQAGQAIQNLFTRCIESGVSTSMEDLLVFNNQEQWFLATHTPLKNEAGQIYRIITTAVDITDRRQIEAELSQRTIELEHTLKELRRTQTQMVQSEKMSGLGQLVAGVAHEINNPVNFIYGNLNHAERYAQDLLGLLELYQQHYPTPHPEIQQEINAIDLDFLIEDLPKLLTSMKVGAERIQKIVASLRIFSRMDEAEMKEVNIHDGIDSTLMILQYRLKAKPEFPGIDVVKDYGNLPLVECYPGQLNQVFMNILSNAIDALEEASVSGRWAKCDESEIPTPTIQISTQMINSNYVEIRIADNGPGIPKAVRPRLFDPFFTTKPVGKGTGMGLSISYQIITEKHSGSLICDSTPEQGAEFVIHIPLRQ